ncbi:MAG TPA: hypothetical protein VHJ20_04585 [Polyangia bacterium]|nr:hypothetical protein [Polyangia bacterium]
MRSRATARLFLIFISFLGTAAATSRAEAYPWMIRHGHDGCVSCHVDPSGSGLLTRYGREEGDEELTMHHGQGGEERKAGLLWGHVDTPDWLLLGAGFRAAVLGTQVTGAPAGSGAPGPSWKADLVLMQADLRAGIRQGPLRASASLGVVNDSSYAAVAGNLVSREHWVGYAPDGDTFLVRAGRMNLPFGIRSIEHTLWVRQETRTDINDLQEHGVAFAYSSNRLRAELMGILGNYQISPDARRQRGYSASVELVPRPGLAVGASSLVTHVAQDVRLDVANWRQAHGLFARASPAEALVILAEADVVHDSPTGASATTGFVSMLQGDVEPVGGLHVILTGETLTPGTPATKSSYGGWAALDWFCLRQFDVRLDFMWRKMAFGTDELDEKAFLVQAHLYL